MRNAHGPEGARPRMGRVKAIGNVEIPQAEAKPGRERAGRGPAPSGLLAGRGFLAILKVEG